MSIVLARIDDRLIHGQVMTSWLNYTGANKIIVIDDVTANDSFSDDDHQNASSCQHCDAGDDSGRQCGGDCRTAGS